MRGKWLIMCLLIILVSVSGVRAITQGQEIISFGADLNRAQRNQLYTQFKPDNRPQMLEVTNQEERRYLSRHIPPQQIGSKAISSVYLKTLSENSGIKVETSNINWVTDGMYANAAVTAGLKNVLIKASAPMPVSGTAALTGVFKAFERVTGQPIQKEKKEVAYQELITTGELGQDLGQKKAEVLIREVKKEVVKKETRDPEEIRLIIEDKADEFNIELTEDQLKQIQRLMDKLTQLNLNVNEINKQLKELNTKVKGIQEKGKEIEGILGMILNFVEKIFDILQKIFVR